MGKKIDLVIFSSKIHSILLKVMRFHNLGHISLKKVGKIDEFPHFGFLLKQAELRLCKLGPGMGLIF